MVLSIFLMRISYFFFSAEESFTSAKATIRERQAKQEEEPQSFSQKDSESFEK